MSSPTTAVAVRDEGNEFPRDRLCREGWVDRNILTKQARGEAPNGRPNPHPDIKQMSSRLDGTLRTCQPHAAFRPDSHPTTHEWGKA